MNKFFSDSLYNIIRQILNILIGMLIVIIVARFLGPSGQGNYALIILFPNVLGTLLNFGVGVSAAYYIGKKTYPLSTVYKTNVILAIILSLLSFFIALIILVTFKESIFGGIPLDLLLLVLITIPFIFFRQFLLVIFQGLQDFKPYNAILVLGKLSNLVVVLFLLIVFELSLKGAVIGFIIGEITSVLIAKFILYKNYSLSLRSGSLSKQYSKDVLIFGIKTHVSNVLAFINYRADIMIISYFLNPASIGLYSVAVNVVERLWVVSQAISTVLFPKISSLESFKERNQLTSAITRVLLLFSILIGLTLYFSASWLTNILFGNEYASATKVFQLLIPGVVLGSVSKIIANDIAGRGRPELNMYVSFIIVGINIILNIILIPLYGISGAAVATTTSYSVNFIIKIFIFSYISKQNIFYFLIFKKSDFLKLKSILKKKSF
ncbi:oligosaccharide flippase family protein [Halobacillus litoralis]|uniref:oligosaccharide flippase family protein n=1 Tax=Halobacillus litoralis TaxID=45668 RepID=UPI00248FFCC3|nr:oligosaccharide flippase family protein [Halobacillus litoralis]